jgi:hypothetical protein
VNDTHARPLRVVEPPSRERLAEIRARLAAGYWDRDTAQLLAEIDRLAARVAESDAIIAEGNQRDRALALLLLRNGGQVEFTETEQVTAPWHGHLISYPNLTTRGLVLAYSADGVTIGVAPEAGACGVQIPASSAKNLGADPSTTCARVPNHVEAAHQDEAGDVMWVDRKPAVIGAGSLETSALTHCPACGAPEWHEDGRRGWNPVDAECEDCGGADDEGDD